MNIKYRLILWRSNLPASDFITSKVMIAGPGGKAEIYNRVMSAVSAASQPEGTFNFFHIEDEDGGDIYLGREVFKQYVVKIQWL